jgi:hypothetical protein
VTAKGFADLVRYRTKTNTTTLTDADLLLVMNMVKDDIGRDIVENVRENFFVVTQTDSLVADQRNYPIVEQSYIMGVDRVEAKLDGTNWVKLEPLDTVNFELPLSETMIVNTFSNNQGDCFFELYRDEVWIYSGTITSVTDGLKWRVYTFPADISDATEDTVDLATHASGTAHGVPKSMHSVWIDKVVIFIKTSGDKDVQLTERERNIEYHYEKALNSLRDMKPIKYDEIDESESEEGFLN